jgi:hypothetical protein
MKGKSALMVGVAAIGLVASAQAGFAAKKASDGTSAPAVPAAAATDNRYDELSTRIEALEQELQGAELRAQEDHAKVDAWKPLSGWWDNTSVSGRMYWDVTNVDAKIKGVDGTGNGFSFDIKRFYIGIDHKFSSIFSANITTDFTYDSTAGATQLYIKKAYLDAKIDPALIVRVGSADLPWVPYSEGVFGYRYVENPLIDRAKFGTSADWGVHVLGKLYDGLLSYQFSAVTGAGYKKTVRTENPDYEGRISLNYEGIDLGIGGYVGHLGTQHGTASYTSAERFNALAAYTIGGLKFGAEYFAATNYGTSYIGSKTLRSHATGVGSFASYQFTPEWSLFGRYDYVKPYSETGKSAVENNYYNVGIAYTPAKMVDIALVYKHDGVDNGQFSTANASNIGGSAFAAGKNGAWDEVGIFGRLQW